MERRTLLKSALALPVTTATACARSAEAKSSPSSLLFTGLPSVDYSLGGLGAGELLAIEGPPVAGKTLLLLDLAARICERYRQNVVFWSAHQPSVYLARKIAIKRSARFVIAEDFADGWDCGADDQPSVIMVSSSAGSDRAYGIAGAAATNHSRRCAVLVMDGWSTTSNRAVDLHLPDSPAVFRAERWPHSQVTAADLHTAKQFAATNRLPVVIGVTTASLVDDQAISESYNLHNQVRRNTDRMVTLYRPELKVKTAGAVASHKNVVCLTGKSPLWWDTRCSRLRFDPRRLGFSTVL